MEISSAPFRRPIYPPLFSNRIKCQDSGKIRMFPARSEELSKNVSD
jgi:hypothetical protein